jgi:hypothetical protein
MIFKEMREKNKSKRKKKTIIVALPPHVIPKRKGCLDASNNMTKGGV